MKIECESTRFVILTDRRAIKIGMVRPIRLLLRILILPFSKKRREHFIGKYGSAFFQATVNDLCAGLYANRGEYEYWQSSYDSRVMPTIQCLLKGWIVVQDRGEAVTSADMEEWTLFIQKYSSSKYELNTPKQFARHPNGRILIIDYGRQDTRLALRASIETSI